jgi:hypothetical protein
MRIVDALIGRNIIFRERRSALTAAATGCASASWLRNNISVIGVRRTNFRSAPPIHADKVSRAVKFQGPSNQSILLGDL